MAQAAELAALRATLAQLTGVLEGLAEATVPPPARLAGGETAAREGEVSVIGSLRSELSREVRDLLADLA
jgi:hypothetical protein